MGKSQSGVARDGASPIQYLSDVVGRNVAPPSEFRGAHPQFFQFFGEMFAGMNRNNSPAVLPNGNQQSPRRMGRKCSRESFYLSTGHEVSGSLVR
jgi:hypothetical protein